MGNGQLPVQDGQVNVAIGEMEGTVGTATGLLHVKGLHVKGRGFFHTPPDFVVDHWAAGGEGGSHHDFRFRHDV